MSTDLGGQHDGENEREQVSPRPTGNVPLAREESCPVLEEWGLFEAALLPEARAMEMAEHASTCGSCGAMLADMHAEPPVDAGVTPMLRSEMAAWKKDMARQLAAKTGTGTAGQSGRQTVGVSQFGKSRFHRKWLAAAAAVMVLMAGGGTWWLRRANSPDAAFRMLGAAYSESRPFAWRIPEANAAPLHQQLGGGVAAPGVTLLRAKLMIAERLEREPENPAWLRAQAREELLESHFAEAIEHLRKAEGIAPADPEIAGDLGIAYVLQAQIEGNGASAARGVESLSTAIAARPADSVFRFNRALAYEMSQLPQQALEDWREVIRLEPSGGWSAEASEHIAALEKKLRDRAQRDSAPAGAEESITVLTARGFEKSRTLDPAAIAEELLRTKQDPWLTHMLAAPASGSNREGLDRLAEASRMTASGNATAAVELATRALRAFQSARNTPGSVFTAFELAYGYQRLAKSVDCLKTVTEALPVAHRFEYRWLEAQLLLTRASCEGAQRRFEAAYDAVMKAQKIADAAGYQTLGLRSLGYRASTLSQVGSYRDALKLDQEGLARFWAGEGDPTRAYQFYYDMANNARGLGYLHAATAFGRAAVEFAAELPNRPVEGLMRATYADLLMQDRRLKEAEGEFARSAAIFQTLPPSPALMLYRSYAELSGARLDGAENRVQAGLDRVSKMEAQLPVMANSVMEAQVWRAKADLLAQAGRGGEGDEYLRRVVSLRPQSGATLAAAGDPGALAGEVSDAVKTLVDRRLEQGDVEAALKLWTDYNTSLGGGVPDATVDQLIYADLPEGLGVWVRNRTGVSFRRLAASRPALVSVAAAFRHLLANPGTPVDRIRAMGHGLYRELVQPVEGALGSAAELVISADQAFDVPFAVLVPEDGHWLGDRYSVSYSPPLTGGVVDHRAGASAGSSLLAATSSHATHVLNVTLPALNDLDRDARAAAAAFPRHVVLAEAGREELLKSLAQADVFHYSGHVIVTSRDAAFVLPGAGDQVQERLLWASQLTPQNLRNVRLAVLAACSTGRAAGEDADPSSTMARAFLLAGVPEVVAARWDVDSSATTALMEGFYRGLKGGESAVKALAESLRSLRKQGAFGHPYYWAGFDVFRI